MKINDCKRKPKGTPLVSISFQKKGKDPTLWATIKRNDFADAKTALSMELSSCPKAIDLPFHSVDSAIAWFLTDQEAIGGLGLFPGEKIIIEVLNQ